MWQNPSQNCLQNGLQQISEQFSLKTKKCFFKICILLERRHWFGSVYLGPNLRRRRGCWKCKQTTKTNTFYQFWLTSLILLVETSNEFQKYKSWIWFEAQVCISEPSRQCFNQVKEHSNMITSDFTVGWLEQSLKTSDIKCECSQKQTPNLLKKIKIPTFKLGWWIPKIIHKFDFEIFWLQCGIEVMANRSSPEQRWQCTR